MSEVPATATPLTRDQTAARFLATYRALFGELPDQQRAELLLALVWLENANGSSLIQGNWGNLATKAREDVSFWRPPWFDLEKVEALADGAKKTRLLDLHDRMLRGQAPEAFRAFPDQDAGARAWLSLLRTPGMQQVLDAASSGDAVAFAHAIFASRYCPDPECRDAGPSYARLRDQIRAAGYFATLKKKVSRARAAVEPLPPGYWFWVWGQLLRLRTSGLGHAVGVEHRLSGEP